MCLKTNCLLQLAWPEFRYIPTCDPLIWYGKKFGVDDAINYVLLPDGIESDLEDCRSPWHNGKGNRTVLWDITRYRNFFLQSIYLILIQRFSLFFSWRTLCQAIKALKIFFVIFISTIMTKWRCMTNKNTTLFLKFPSFEKEALKIW